MVAIKTDLSLDDKLELSLQLARFEQCPDLLSEEFIYPARAKGKVVPVFKILLSNICYNNCFYCANRASRNCKRYKFKIDEVVKVFMNLYSRGKVNGLFISSGVYDNPSRVQLEILKVIEILRKKYHYPGYIHSKVIPGANLDVTEAVLKFSDRVSLNLEAPGEKYIARIAPRKNFLKLYTSLKKLSQLAKKYGIKSGATTQIIVGVGEEDDRTILSFAYRLYTQLGINRVYYSGFQPVKFTPLEGNLKCEDLRITRLYQADYLIRLYGFKPQELIYDLQGNLILDKDPKLAWAEKNLIRKININKAGFPELIRVPGIGHNLANRIINLRRKVYLTPSRLRELGIYKSQILKFIQL